MIKLTSTETHEYYAVALPKDVKDFDRVRKQDGEYSLWYNTPMDMPKDISISVYESKSIKIGGQFWILGVIGNGGDISQEIAQEISEATLGIKITHHPKDKPDYINWLKFKLIEKGILVENSKVVIIKVKI